MPDWTYSPLRRPMAAFLGQQRSRRAALRLIATLARLPGGNWLVAGFGHTWPPPEATVEVAGVSCSSRFGASVGAELVRDSVNALPALGAGLLEVGPFSVSSLEQARQALETARCPVALRLSGSGALQVAAAAGSFADLVIMDMSDSASAGDVLDQLRELVSVPVVAGIERGGADGLPPGMPVVIRNATPGQVQDLASGARTIIATTSNASPANAADLVTAGATAVLATPAALVDAGPGWFHRATMVQLARTLGVPRDTAARRVQWLAGLALGLGMIAGGVGAGIVALGPVVLPYDLSFLGLTPAALAGINPQLIHFLQHDRITLAGTLVAIGILYSSLSWWGIRQGRAWARDALLASGVVGFPTLFYFFSYGYVEPVHVALAAFLFPLFLAATWRRSPGFAPAFDDDGPPQQRGRALLGQLLMVTAGAGLVLGGLTISFIGVTSVFVPTDLTFMNTSADILANANHRLLPFVAHDRAGFGGALISAGVAVSLLAAWGWERGEAWVWWSLLAAASSGFGAALAIHFRVAYTDFGHVAPIYAGILVTGIALGLGGPFLLAARPRAVPKALGR